MEKNFFNMVQFERITDVNTPLFDRLMGLYIYSFPEEERRNLDQLKKMMGHLPEMCLNAVYQDGDLSGLVIYWDFAEFYYFEHLAVFPELRNRQIGKQILDYWAAHLKKLRLLEVEPADSPMAIRRIGFYQRNGYQVIHKEYIQPSYYKDEDACPLWIMGSEPHADIKPLLSVIKEKVYREPLQYL